MARLALHASFGVVLAACGATGPRPAPPPPADLDVSAQSHATAAVAAPVVVPAPAPPVAAPPPIAVVDDSPDHDTLDRLHWAPSTMSFVLRSSSAVYAEPSATSTALGKIIFNTRLRVGESAAGDRTCKTWLRVAPAGWICARDVHPSTLPPEAIVQPVVPDGQLVPHDYFGIKLGAARYATEDDVRANLVAPEPKARSAYMVTRDKELEIDGVAYVKTGVGLVAASDLYRFAPSTFAGIDLAATPPPGWPFAWVVATNERSVVTRATPDKKGDKAGTLAHRQIVPVLEESAGFVRVADDQWVDRKSLRIARLQPRPTVDGAAAKWIDLDRDEQVMVAYDGDRPVYATMFSSGRADSFTPPAIYRIRSKSAAQKMAAEERESSHYEVSEVPWATRFRSGLYFHAAYWHDEFGTPKSHGCVNLAPHDAKWVYDWTEPTMPAGWNELEVPMAGAMVVRVHDAKHPDPPVFDYDREAIERVGIRRQEALLKKKREAAEAAARAAVEAPDPAPPSTR